MASEEPVETTLRKTGYESPRLTRYGHLKDLTTGGSGTAQESSSGKNPRP
jgi:hypothetical protein